MAVALLCPDCSAVDVAAASRRASVGAAALARGPADDRSRRATSLQGALQCGAQRAWGERGARPDVRGEACASDRDGGDAASDRREAKPGPRRLPSPVPPRASATKLMRPRAFSSGSGPTDCATAAEPPNAPLDCPLSPKSIPSASKAPENGVVGAEGKGDFPNANTNSSTRMNRLDSFRMRLRKGASETCLPKGPMVARHPSRGDGAPGAGTPASQAPASAAASAAVPGGTSRLAASLASPGGRACSSEATCETPRSPSPVVNVRRTSPATLSRTMYNSEGNHARKRSPSLNRSRPSSPGNGTSRRPASPSALDPIVLEAVKRRVRRVQKARLYLLQQPGPNSFLVGGDSPEHKYKVVIGPQTCSCGRGPFCLHLLFVMLRVFQVPENDSKLYTKELKNYEVESLFQHYQQRRNSRVHVMPEENQGDSSSCKNCHQSSVILNENRHTDSPPVEENKSEEEELCPICLLEMIDGESLVICMAGCRNKLHLHCMAVWAVECGHQGENVLCPLCRQPWHDESSALKSVPEMLQLENSYSKNVPDLPSPSKEHSSILSPWEVTGTTNFQHLPGPGPGSGSIPSPISSKMPPSIYKPQKSLQYLSLSKPERYLGENVQELTQNNNCSSNNSPYDVNNSVEFCVKTCSLQADIPHSLLELIPSEHMTLASEWIKVFGIELIVDLYSKDSKHREKALKVLVNNILTVHQCEDKERQYIVAWCCAKILAMVVGDPAFKVYLWCIRCFKVLMKYVACHSACHLEEYQNLLRPIIKGLLKKCADRHHRTSVLSVEVLMEISKSQCRDVSVTQTTTEAHLWGINGLELVLGCILEHFAVETVNWQWLAGRLLMLNTLLHLLPNEFCLKYVPLYANESGYKLNNFNRLFSVIEFSFKALQSSHSSVSKLARHVFVLSSSMTTAEKGMLNQILDMISGLDSALQSRLKKRLQAAIERQMQHQNFQKKSRNHHYSQEVNINPTTSSKVDLQGNVQVNSKGSLQTVPVRPKDLPLDSVCKNKKVLKCQQMPNGPSFSTPSKRWINSSSKLSSLFSRTKKSVELLPTNKFDSLGSCELDCGYGTSETPSSPSENCPCESPGDEDSMSFFTRVMGCISYSPSDKTENEKIEISAATVELSQDTSQDAENTNEIYINSEFGPEVINVETLVRPIKDSLEKKNMESIAKIKSYVEDFHWKRGPLLGTGAYSVCYQAWDIETGSLMAVKQVPYCRNSEEEQVNVERSIRKEIMTMSKLRHQNVLTILGATREGNHFNIFVEWMAGGSVAAMLENYGPFNPCVITKYTKQVLEGLNYLHENHILHRDLKGANLLVDSTGNQLRIGDFGTAACLEFHGTVPGELRGQLLGTIAFMAPEVLRGENYGRSCDIWSVGCCMIEMATTKAPWKENQMSNHLALMYKIASSTAPPFIPESLGPATKDLAHKCLQVEAELRPTAKELLNHQCFKVPNYFSNMP